MILMKLSITGLVFFLANFCFGQELQHDKIFIDYEQLLEEINNGELKQRVAEYKCSEDVYGEVHFFYRQDSLRLIKHAYKQGVYQEYAKENYYLKGDSLLLQTVFTEMINLNTNYYSNSQGSYVSGAEKFLELKEERRLISPSNFGMICYERSFGAKISEWDQDYFNTLDFSKAECVDYLNDTKDKFKLLRKVEQKFLNSLHKNPPCIFHVW